MKIDAFAFEGEGMARVYENTKWTVGVKNWKPANDVAGIDCLERHNETDELFVLLAGRCTLISAEEKDGELVMEATPMQPNKVYSIPQSLWHNTVTEKDTKLVLIEDVSTGMENSDILPLTPEQAEALRALVK